MKCQVQNLAETFIILTEVCQGFSQSPQPNAIGYSHLLYNRFKFNDVIIQEIICLYLLLLGILYKINKMLYVRVMTLHLYLTQYQGLTVGQIFLKIWYHSPSLEVVWQLWFSFTIIFKIKQCLHEALSGLFHVQVYNKPSK